MTAYEWQDETRAHESITRDDGPFTFVNPGLLGGAIVVHRTMPARIVPLYLRLDPDRWPITIAWLAAVEGESPVEDLWHDILQDQNVNAKIMLGFYPLTRRRAP